MNYNLLIKELESKTSRIFKENVILREMRSNNDIFFEGLAFACDKLFTFGIKKVLESKLDGPGLEWDEFKNCLLKLNKREITGNQAKNAVNIMLEKSTKDEWNYFYRRILIKDLRCGLSEKTINNVARKNNFPKYEIPVFQCQLAQDSELHKKKLVGTKLLEVKLDGVRAISIIHSNGNVDMFSRNGKELLNFENIKQQLAETFEKRIENRSIVLDGELISKNFQDLMKQIYRKDNVQNNDANLYLFDFLDLTEFKSGVSNKIQEIRMIELNDWYKKNQRLLSKVKLLDTKIVDLDTENGKEEFKQFNNNSVIDGFEGIMIKDPKAKYECKRSSSWLKSKPVIEVSLTVKSIEEGTGKNKGRLGAISAEGKDNNKKFKISVGSGFSDMQRNEFWENKELILGQIIEIKADAITKSQDGEFWSLRFPRFKTFRGFKKNEKI